MALVTVVVQVRSQAGKRPYASVEAKKEKEKKKYSIFIASLFEEGKIIDIGLGHMLIPEPNMRGQAL